MPSTLVINGSDVNTEVDVLLDETVAPDSLAFVLAHLMILMWY